MLIKKAYLKVFKSIEMEKKESRYLSADTYHFQPLFNYILWNKVHIIKINNFLKILSHFFQNQRILIHWQDRFRKFRICRHDKITLGKFDFEVGEKTQNLRPIQPGLVFTGHGLSWKICACFGIKTFPF